MKIFTLCLTVVAVLASPDVLAQQTTEVYIPIGESPGVSRDKSWIGDIRDVDYSAMQMQVDTPQGMRSIKVDGKTRFYLDRASYGKKNSTGDMRDCRVGSRIEAYVDSNGKAYWIKIKTD